jgi:hypothetical protein
VEQLPPLHVAQPDEAADEEYFPLLLKLHADRSRSTFFPLQWGQDTELSLPNTMHSKFLRQFLHLNS